MANGEQTNGSNPFGSISVNIDPPDTSFNPDVSLETTIRDNFSEYAGVNAHWLRRELLQNNDRFEDVSRDMFLASMGEQELGSLNEDPEEFNRRYSTFRKNFKSKLTDNAFAGESFSTTLINRTLDMTDTPEEIPVDNYLSTLRNNKGKYQEAGLLDQNGELLYSDESFTSELLSNQNLHRQIISDRYKDFQQELSKQHNVASFFNEDPELLTTAWSVYDHLGSEGVTQFVNTLQFRSEEGVNEGFSQQEQAQEFFNNAQVAGRSPQEFVSSFVAGEKLKGVPQFKNEILRSATKHKIPPSLLASVINRESSFNPDAVGGLGEIGLAQIMPACLTTDVRALTKEGLKYWYEIKKGEELLTYNLEKDKLEFQPIKRIYYYEDLKTPLVRLYNEGFDFTMTNNHKWVVEKRQYYKNPTKKTIELRETKDIGSQDYLLRISDYDAPKSKIIDDNLVRLVGFIFCDGTINFRKGKHTYCEITIYQKKNVDYIQNLLDLLGFTYRKTKTQEGTIRWDLHKKSCVQIQDYLYNGDRKTLTPEFLFNLTNKQFDFLWEGIEKGDGWVNKNSGHLLVCQSNKKRFEDLQIASFLKGNLLDAHCVREEGKTTFPTGKTYNTKKKYQASLRRRKYTSLKKDRINRELVDPEPVWCPSVENKTWVAYSKGHFSITGNTGDSLGVSVEQLRDPQTNIDTSAKLLSQLLEETEDPEVALAYYNARRNTVDNALEQARQTGRDFKEFLPESTQEYIPNVLQGRQNYVEGTPQNYLTFQPLTPRDDLNKEVPKDANNWMASWYKSKTDHAEQIAPDYGIEKFVKGNFPEFHAQYFNKGEVIKDGVYSPDYTKLAFKVYERAATDGEFEINDLINTLLANKTGWEDKGRPRYSIDYNSLSVPQKLAFDALQFDDEAGSMFENLGGGRYLLMPNRTKEYSSIWRDIKDTIFRTNREIVEDENGNKEIVETPDTGLVGQVWNTAMTAMMGGADALLRFMVEPSLRFGNSLSEQLGVGSELTKKYESALQGLLTTHQSEITSRETDGLAPSFLGEMMPFIEYMGAMYAGGRATLGGSAGLMRSITGSKKMMDTMRLGQAMQGSPRLAGIAEKLYRGVSSKQPWATGFGVFYTGGALVEATQPEQHSFYNIIPTMLGYDRTNDVTELYNTTSDLGRVAMDIGASLTFDFMADNIIAFSRFFGSKGAQKFFGRKEFASMSYDEATGGYIKTESGAPQFKHDLVEFWHNLTRDLARAPQGEVGATLAKGFIPKGEAKTLHDFTKIFTDETGEVVTGIRNEVRKHIEWLQDQLGDGVKLSDEQLNKLSEEQYQAFLDKTTERIYGVLKTADPEDPTSLPLRFAQALDEQTPTVRRFRLDSERVNPSRIGELREDGYNVIAKDGDVFEVDGKFWTTELAHRIRQEAVKVSKNDVLDRKLAAEGIDRTAKLSAEESDRIGRLEEQVEATIGTPVTVRGQRGIIIDWDDTGFKVRTSEGDVVSGVRVNEEGLQGISSPISDARLRARETVVELTEGLREQRRLALPARGETTRPPQRLLPAPKSITQGDYVQGRVAEFDRPRQVLDARQQDGQTFVRTTGTTTYVPADDLRLVRKAELTSGRQTGQALRDEAELLNRFHRLDEQIEEMERRKSVLDTVVDDPERRAARADQLDQVQETLEQQRRATIAEIERFYEGAPEKLRSARMDDNTIGTIRGLQREFTIPEGTPLRGEVVTRNIDETRSSINGSILDEMDRELLDNYQKKLTAFAKAVDKAAKSEFELPYCR